MKRFLLMMLLCLSGIGCQRNEGEKLARIGGKVAEKVQALVPERLPFGMKKDALEDRIKERIHQDRYLTAETIDVTADGSGVRLRGKIASDALKKRAVELAESTVGVEKVTDEMFVAK